MGLEASVAGVGWNGDPAGSTLAGVSSARGFTTPGKSAERSNCPGGEAPALAVNCL